MPDDYFTRTQPPAAAPPRKPAGVGRLILAASMLSFLLGGGLIGWLAYAGKLRLDSDAVQTAAAPLSRPAGNPSAAPTAAPTGIATTAGSASPAPALAQPGLTGGLEQRMAQIEQRLNTLDLRAQAATGNAARAEGLLIALASRRAIERGMPLGSLADQLRLRFGDAQPRAMQVVIDGAKTPVTLVQLDTGLTELSDQLTKAAAEDSGWTRFTRQLSDMFVIRRTDSAAVRPEAQLDQARLLLRSGQTEGAANLVAQLPGARAAADWIAEARRFAALQQALDQLEAAAILEPRELQDGRGQPVRQVSPAAEPMF
jgi:hypothetical protein